MDTFNFYRDREHDYGIEFKTDVDSEYSAHEQRNDLWRNPRRSWTLTFSKTPAQWPLIEAFFVAQKGKKKSFYWKYDKTVNGKPAGGDDVTYTVRFDTDKLEVKVNELGYKSLTISIIEVVTSE